jgi:hypothetical protein
MEMGQEVRIEAKGAQVGKDQPATVPVSKGRVMPLGLVTRPHENG